AAWDAAAQDRHILAEPARPGPTQHRHPYPRRYHQLSRRGPAEDVGSMAPIAVRLTVHCGHSVNESVIEVVSVRARNGNQDATDRSTHGQQTTQSGPTLIS